MKPFGNVKTSRQLLHLLKIDSLPVITSRVLARVGPVIITTITVALEVPTVKHPDLIAHSLNTDKPEFLVEVRAVGHGELTADLVVIDDDVLLRVLGAQPLDHALGVLGLDGVVLVVGVDDVLHELRDVGDDVLGDFYKKDKKSEG